MLIQPDYGGFNSRFLGIQLRFHALHPEVFGDFITFISSKPDHVVAQGNAALQSSFERAFHVFSLGSVLEHEMRHFHDFLLSPLSQSIYRLRVAAIFHGIQGVPDIKQHGFVPVPLVRWLRLPAEEKSSRLRQWAGFLKNMPDTFIISDDERSMLSLGDDCYHAMHSRLVSQRIPKIQPVHLFEASALLVQHQAIVQNFGAPHAAKFIAALYQQPGADDYKLVFNMLVNLWNKWSMPCDFRAMSAVLIWSIAGASTAAEGDDYPTIRFLRLFEYLNHSGIPVAGTAVVDWFSQWDAALGSVPIENKLQDAVDANENLLEQLNNIQPTADKLFTVVAKGCLQAMQCLATLSRQMLKDFKRMSEIYVDPAQYINQVQFVSCPIRVDFLNGGVEASRFTGSNFMIWRTENCDKGNSLVTSAYLQPPGNNWPVTTDAVMNAALALDFGDFLFCDFSRDGADFDAIRRSFRQHIGIVPLEVF